MAETLDFESDLQLVALTDALRAGPGSPEWRDAVARIRAQGGDQADEYLLLCTAREHLASGKSYREIHAGPSFSRKVMEAVEQEQSGERSKVAPTAGIVVFLSALLIVAVVGSIGYYLWHTSGAKAPPKQDLGQVLFVDTAFEAKLDESPQGWTMAGTLPLRFENGLRPDNANVNADFAGGAILWSKLIPAEQATQLEVSVRLPSPESKLVAQVFVTDDRNLSAARGTSPHELTWTYGNGQAGVAVASGRLESASWKPAAKQDRAEVRIQFDAQSAAIDTAGQRLWSGEHGLDPAKPRYVGVRFLAPKGEKADPNAAFESVRVTKPRSP
jgi:hypothetical protein